MTTQVVAGDAPVWTLRDRLRKAREHAGLEQVELAERAGISRGSVSNYENGVTSPRRPQLLAWAMACGVPLEWLTDGDTPAVDVRTPRRSRRRFGRRRTDRGLTLAPVAA
jgi:transcriptional regulator with XRE-family HTH domain